MTPPFAHSPGLPDSGLGTIHPAFRLLTENFTDVRTDAMFRQTSADINYAFDVFDLVQYAFPVDITRQASVTDQTYNDQVALFEVFQSSQLLLLPEYKRELTSYLDAVAAQNIRTERLALALKGTSELSADRSVESIASELSRNVHAHLAVLMGFTHIGMDRMLAVKNRVPGIENLAWRLNLPELCEPPEVEVAEQIFDELWSFLQEGSHRLAPYALQKLRNGARADADAVARIIHLNNIAENAFASGRIKRRNITLYLSTANRSQRLFSLNAVRRALPVVQGKPLQILRTRGQVFAGIILREFKSGARDEEDFEQTFKLIDSLEPLRERVKGAASKALCQNCPMDGGTGTGCPVAQLCRHMKDGREVAFQNQSLVPQLKRYEQLLNQRPQGAQHSEYMNFFRRVLAQERLPDIVLARRHATLASRLLVDDNFKASQHQTLRNYLPAIPKVRDETYRRICSGVLQYPSIAATKPAEASRRLHQLEGEFLKLDEGAEFSVDREISRAILYVTLGSAQTAGDSVMAEDGDVRAIEYCRQMMIHFPEEASEFRFIMIWALARMGERDLSQAGSYLKEGRVEANIGIEQSPSDGRFYHGRSLITSCLFDLQDPLNRKQKGGAWLKEMLEDAEKAIDLYVRDQDQYRFAIAVNLNNVAWHRSQSEYATYKDATGIYNPSIGAGAVERLRAIYPIKDWGTELPHALHTAAHVYLTLWQSSQREQDLQTAYEYIIQAYRARPTADVVLETKRDIEVALNSLSTEGFTI